MKNTSVKEVELAHNTLDCSSLMEAISQFKSIEILNIRSNCISDLSPLDPLLIGESATLRSLELSYNEIREGNGQSYQGGINELAYCFEKANEAFPERLGICESVSVSAGSFVQENRNE